MLYRRSFTLIELLIVVAIIGILAAIAVPNFINAQIRAKISRAMADMKASSTAIEMNRVDRNVLLVDGYDQELEWGKRRIKEVFDGIGDFHNGKRSYVDVLMPLTTPIAYMSSIPNDPLINHTLQKERVAEIENYTLTNSYSYADDDPEDPEHDQLSMRYHPETAEQYNNRPLLEGEFVLISTGPDGVTAPEDLSKTWELIGIPYDASNGLTSWGDIVMRSGGE